MNLTYEGFGDPYFFTWSADYPLSLLFFLLWGKDWTPFNSVILFFFEPGYDPPPPPDFYKMIINYEY